MTRDALLHDLSRVREEVAGYFAALPLEELYRREGDAWAPVDDLRHLTLSVGKVTAAFRIPAEALRARFGVRDEPYRSRHAVGAIALEGLRNGGRATGDISPEPVPADQRTEAFRDTCLQAWREAARTFEEALATWPDEELDRHQVPHPFLGPFSLREWADFNVLHAEHHRRVAERRLGRGGGGARP